MNVQEYFIKAKPVWLEGGGKEMNVQAGSTCEILHRDTSHKRDITKN